jgi:hypothetical protein
MIATTIEPMEPSIWFERLGKLLASAVEKGAASPESVIRQAFHLVKLAPGPFREILPIDLDEERMERLLGCGGYESAVMALIGDRTTFSVHKVAGEQTVTAALSLDPHAQAGLGAHSSCAKAMLQAWVLCLANVAGVEMPGAVRNPDRRRSRSGSLRSSTAH